MLIPNFSRLFPTLYHLTFAVNLDGLRTHGLHSTASLAALHQASPADLEAAVFHRRRAIQTLASPLGHATLRDQHTATESLMKSCLVQISIPEWLALLNSKVFFFVDPDRMARLQKSYSAYPQILLETDTRALLEAHAAHATLSRINTGSFIRRPTPRGRNSFIPFADYTYKNKRDLPAELSFDCPIPHILQISSVRELPAQAEHKS